MASEQTPLLSESGSVLNEHEARYLRFSRSRKRVILMMVAWCGFIPLFVAGVFIPSVPRMAIDLNTTATAISLAISMAVLAVSLGTLFGGAYSTYYGRRFVYLCGFPLLCVGSIGVGLSTSVPQLLISRFIQAFGCSPALAVGGAVIGDIYKLEERGRALGIFFSASFLGAAIAPTAGGLFAHYASWRITQLAIVIAGAVTYIGVYLFFPETCQPGTRGIEKRPLNEDGSAPHFKFVFINPFGSLWLLRSPNLLAVSMIGFLALLSDYALLVPLVYTIAARYGITNEAFIGLCFLPSGLGNMIGAPTAGWMSDQVVIKWRKKNGGVWYPEDRLRAATWGVACIVPLSIIGSGLAIKFVDGKIGLALNMICLFMNGIGIDIVFTPSAAYIVDILHAKSAEGLGVNTSFRGIIMSFAIAGIFPMINAVGVTLFDTLIGVSALSGFGILLLTIRYGERMRAWVDVGYSTEENN